eukprot:9814388-Alexandrium_andersonii.AAC.2
MAQRDGPEPLNEEGPGFDWPEPGLPTQVKHWQAHCGHDGEAIGSRPHRRRRRCHKHSRPLKQAVMQRDHKTGGLGPGIDDAAEQCSEPLCLTERGLVRGYKRSCARNSWLWDDSLSNWAGRAV